MIASIHGTVIAVSSSRAVIDVQGVGYAVAIAPRIAQSLRVGEQTRLHTALIVREDDMSLYGFADELELGLFDLLRSVSGVGPKSALGVLGAMTPDEAARAITDGDDAPFRRVSGIGPKTAKLIVVSLSGRIAPPSAAAQPSVTTAPANDSDGAARTALAAALTGLGWPERTAVATATAVVESARADVGDGAPLPGLSALLRTALAELGPAGGRS
ncbi:Holliday junction DNA helicase subunit RuvA [Microcella putealis]|uniref:Holliday junction branch migration complex subunit RuvA n=1 Tax=Microcella putealis TaxID=337005 RepID=A0A4Q7LKV4_9MICO|nr:Holliday junction branch migration protein RuvA [Microcella putealis]RZS54258.1 Holliday junction DNA helicase subunit RuvA [Microcella putealis]TQM24988.1 Holliday junction DNA helicase subunit RuvA [Microcella putealis]